MVLEKHHWVRKKRVDYFLMLGDAEHHNKITSIYEECKECSTRRLIFPKPMPPESTTEEVLASIPQIQYLKIVYLFKSAEMELNKPVKRTFACRYIPIEVNPCQS